MGRDYLICYEVNEVSEGYEVWDNKEKRRVCFCIRKEDAEKISDWFAVDEETEEFLRSIP